VTVSGTGFRASRSIAITFDDTSIGTATTDVNGSFSASISVPVIASGTYEVEATDGTYTNSADFTIAASFSLSQATGYIGAKVTVSGSGFKANTAITITLDNISVGTATTDANGNFNSSFSVPVIASGTYKVETSDGTFTNSVDFTVSVTASLSQAIGDVGTELTIDGVGFIGIVSIKYDDVEVATATVDSNGAFSATFNIPEGKHGAHTITVTGSTNTHQLTFTMESVAPPIPAPLKPEMNAKAKATAYFDWEDVTDPSGVTYTLQIAADELFNEDSIVFEKEGLIDSDYVITKEEKLAPVEQEAPYYWHVKAVDGASNESGWSGTGLFYVGFSFSLPQWAIYALYGLGTLLIGYLGFWLGSSHHIQFINLLYRRLEVPFSGQVRCHNHGNKLPGDCLLLNNGGDADIMFPEDIINLG